MKWFFVLRFVSRRWWWWMGLMKGTGGEWTSLGGATKGFSHRACCGATRRSSKLATMPFSSVACTWLQPPTVVSGSLLFISSNSSSFRFVSMLSSSSLLLFDQACLGDYEIENASKEPGSQRKSWSSDTRFELLRNFTSSSYHSIPFSLATSEKENNNKVKATTF